jgi:hypothetical protein
MELAHPHAEATYRVIASGDGTFTVEVSIPGTYPAKVSRLPRKPDAEAWIVEHQRRVQAQSQPNSRFRRPGTSVAKRRGRPE